MQGAQQLVLGGGLALIGVNLWVGPQHTALAGVLWGTSNADPADAHTAMLEVGAELLFVMVATFGAGSSPSVGTGIVAAIVALWVLWAIRYYTTNDAGKVSAANAAAKPSQAAQAADRFPIGTATTTSTAAGAARLQVV